PKGDEKVDKSHNRLGQWYHKPREIYLLYHLLLTDYGVSRLVKHKCEVCPRRHAGDGEHRIRYPTCVYFHRFAEHYRKNKKGCRRLKKSPHQSQESLRIPYPQITVRHDEEKVTVVKKLLQVYGVSALVCVYDGTVRRHAGVGCRLYGTKILQSYDFTGIEPLIPMKPGQ